MTNALGQMPNAPLIYVLAQIRFTHIPRMDKRWEDFHETIFEDYPNVEAEQIQQFGFKDGQPVVGDGVKRWHLVNETRTTGVILDAETLIFHTTGYITSADFFSRLRHVLMAFSPILPEKGVHVSRLGLRYVDLLLPEEDLTIDDQIIETLRLPQLSEVGKPQRMDQVVTYQTPVGGTMIVRHRQSITPDILPADIFPNKLEVASRLKRKRPENMMVGLLDYDHSLEKELAFDLGVIAGHFGSLRESTSTAFKATTTGSARQSWQKEAS